MSKNEAVFGELGFYLWPLCAWPEGRDVADLVDVQQTVHSCKRDRQDGFVLNFWRDVSGDRGTAAVWDQSPPFFSPEGEYAPDVFLVFGKRDAVGKAFEFAASDRQPVR